MDIENEKKIEDGIMAKIKSGQIKIRSKYVFLAEKLGLKTALILSVFLAILFFGFVFSYLKAGDNLKYLSFGSSGILAFWESFPFGLVVGFVIFLLIAGYFINKNESAYKHSFGKTSLILVFAVIGAGIVFAFSGFSEKMEEQSFRHRSLGFFFRPVFDSINHRNRGLAGRISEINADYWLIETPMGWQKIRGDVLNNVFPEKGQFVVVLGKKIEEFFEVEKIRIFDQKEMPMINRGIIRRFREMPAPNPRYQRDFNLMEKNCFGQCLDSGFWPGDCSERCFGGFSK